MLMFLVTFYSLYVLLSIYTSVMQIGFISSAKKGEAVLLNQRDFLSAAKYSVAKEKLSIVNSFVDYILFLFWIGFGIKFLQDSLFFESEALLNVASLLVFILFGFIVSIPFSYYEKFVLDQEAGFNKSSKSQWLKDTLISFITTLLLGGVVAYVLYLIISSFSSWWIFGFIFLFLVVVLINIFFPTFRAKFFDKLTPLEDVELDTKIKELMKKTAFESSGVFVSDASKRDSRLNAYFGGLGKTKRVVLFDTLLQKLSHRELLAVLGHELGHYAHGDIYKNIAIVGAMLFVAFLFFGNIPSSLYLELGVSSEPWVVMVLFLIIMSPLGFFMMPLLGVVSRHNEYEADKMGSFLCGNGGEIELANALVKLVNENKSFPLSHPIYIFFHYTHPPVIERLKALGMNIKDVDTKALGSKCQADI